MKYLLLFVSFLFVYLSVAQNTKIVDYPDREAKFKGGPKAMKQYLAKNINYPQEAIENNEQGKVFVEFVVEINGQLSNVRVLKGVSPSLNQEAMRVIRKMPKWKPAKYKGQKCIARCRVPISFLIR